ncbi:signal recognition particle protein [Litorimonas sp. RW-G-Af-16]|uniref:signal recognition particle protein n=1 Tax=Litorimonas sp. RW-G-Af-16 TaxID=3241168 RepID=UPI003AAEFB33
MFEALGDKLSNVFDGLTGRGALSEKDVNAAMREIRIALLEADVALPVVKDFVERVRKEAVGEKVIKSIKPGQMVVKIVNDALIETLGGTLSDEDADKAEVAKATHLNLAAKPPVVILMAGLQGSGKTTTTGKLGLYLRSALKKKVLFASLDTNRPAAMEQLGMLAKQAEVSFLEIVKGQSALDIAKRAMKEAKLGSYDVVILDTAGRTTINEELMAEVEAVAKETQPTETLLVADSLTGQDAVETAQRFHARLPLTGLVLTRIDGDGRGGAALSMRAVTGLPIKFLGTGEKMDGLEAFDAERLAGRILGQGDIVSLVERASQVIDEKDAALTAEKMRKGQFDLEDLGKQLGQMQKMGGMGGLMKLMPGMGKMKKQLDAAGGIDDQLLKQQQAIILSMTPAERRKPELIKASRKKRIAAGAGMSVQEVNKLLKMHRQMSDMMKKMGKGGMAGIMQAMGGMPGMPKMPGGMSAKGGGMPNPADMSPEQLEDLKKSLPRDLANCLALAV